MRSLIYVILLSFIVSCASSQGITAIQYKRQKIEGSSKNATYSMMIPKGYKLITLVGGHSELEQQYIDIYLQLLHY